MGCLGASYDIVQSRALVGYLTMPSQIDIIQRPDVLKISPGRSRPNGSTIVTVRIKRRILVDQVDAVRSQSAHHIKVVPDEYCPVGDVGCATGHGGAFLAYPWSCSPVMTVWYHTLSVYASQPAEFLEKYFGTVAWWL